MTDARPDLNVLALNSGSSSLKFGLYRVGFSRTQMLLSGKAEAIGEEKSKFRAQDGRGDALLSETISVPSQLEAIVRNRQTSCRVQHAGAGRNRASNRAWRTEAPTALPH
jgi:acetate kinase